MTADSDPNAPADAVPDCCAPGRASFLVPSPGVAGCDAPTDVDRA